MKIIFKILAGSIALVVVPVFLYALMSLVLSAIPVKGKPAEGKNIEIFLMSNGVHTDLVLPLKNNLKDWSKEVKFEHTAGKDTVYRYLAFGWGDKGFYLETPTWADLKFKTAVRATFGLGTTAVHTTFVKSIREDNDCIKLMLSNEQYLKLISYIVKTFARDKNRNIQLIKTTANYGSSDAFYEAVGSYSLFKTCNTWTNKGLKACSQKACLWTPFDKGMFWHYR